MATLTSACNGAPSQVGRFEFGVMGSCRSTDLSVQGSPIESRSFLSESDDLMGSCCSTDLSAQRGPIPVRSCLLRWEGVLSQH